MRIKFWKKFCGKVKIIHPEDQSINFLPKIGKEGCYITFYECAAGSGR